MPHHGNYPLQRIKGLCPHHSRCGKCLLRIQRGNAPAHLRLLIGIPGKSNAFAISKKLGLPDFIIEDAKSHLEAKDESFEDLLASLETSRVTIEKEQEEIRSYKEEIAQLKSRLTQKEERLDERKDKLIRNASEEAQRILREAKETADQTIREINRLASESGVGKELELREPNCGSSLKRPTISWQ